MAKKLMALLLAVLMAVSLLPMPALAAEGTGDLTNIAGGGDFTLTADTTLTQSLEITGNVTLDLGGHTVKFSPANTEGTNLSAIIIKSGSLTLKGRGTINVPDAATAVSLAGSDTALTVQDDVSITGGDYGVKTSTGTGGVKIAVNTTGKISAKYGILLSGKDAAAVSITAGTVCGTTAACGYVDGETVTALTASAVRAEGSVLYVDGSEASNDPALAAGTFVFDDGKAPELTAAAKRTEEKKASVSISATKAGTYYYQLGESEPAAEDLFALEGSKTTLAKGANALELDIADGAEHKLYLAAQDAFGHKSGVVTVTIPAVLAAPENPVWGGENGKTATWTLVDGTSYTVQLLKDGTEVKTYTPVTAAPNCADDITASGDGSYTFRVCAIGENTVGAWAASDAISVDTTAPVITAGDAVRSALNAGSFPFKSNEAGTLYYVLNTEPADIFAAESSTMAVQEGENTLELSLTDSAAVTVYYAAKDKEGNASKIATVTVPPYEEPADTTPPTVSDAAGQRTEKDTGSVTLKSDEAGKLYYVVGGEAPATADALIADPNKKEQPVNANEEVKLDLTGLPTDAVNVYLLVKDAAGNASDVKTVTVPRYLVLAKPTAATWLNGGTTAMWGAVTDATAYNVQLLKDGSEYGNVTVVNGDTTNTVELKDSMKDDGVYTFRVQATAGETQSEWSDVSVTSYTRDTTPPTITSHPSSRKDAKTAEFSFTSSEQGTYYYMIGTVGGGQPTVEQVVNDANPHGGCTQSAKTIIKLSDIADTNARIAYVVVRDNSGNLSRTSDGKPYAIQIPAYTSQPTATPTAAPTAPPTAAPTTYTVTLQGGTGYTIAATGGSKSPVNAGGSFSFTVTPNNGYTRGTGFAVKANGTTLTSNNGVYTISNINANQTVSVSGIVQKSTSGGTLPAAPAITTTTLAAATMGKEYRQQLTATGGTPITWSYSGTLPDGMTLAANTGILSGTPTQEGSFRFAVKATNSTGFSTRQMTLVVAGSEYTVTKGANSEWTQGGDKGIDLSGSGKGSFTVKVDGAAVPAGKYTASSDGSTITLKPEYLDTLAAGSHTVTLVYTDGSAKAKFTIKAKDKTVAPTVSSQPLNAEAAEGSSATFTVTASGTTPLLCQWQVDKNDGKGWTDIIGAVNASYTVETITAEQNGWKYRCVIKNAAGSVESNAATLTVKEAIGDVKKNDDTKNNSSNRLGRILLITGIVVAVLALGAGLYFYFRRRNSTRYMD